MAFNDNKAIYLQMADRLADDVLAGRYGPGERIPSVREYAVNIGVNPNTAVKAYEELAREGVIYNRRGLGYFVSGEARERIREKRKSEFFRDILPEVARQMTLLDISVDELVDNIHRQQSKDEV